MTETVIDIDPELPNRIAVWTDYRLKDKVKAVPGAKWSPEHRRWTVPLSWPSCLALRAELGREMRIQPDLVAWAMDERETKSELLALRTELGADDEERLELDGFDVLFPYQLVGGRIIQAARDYLLFDEQGLGKGRTVLAGLSRILHLDGEQIFPLVIVAPKSMLYTWREEVLGFFPDADISVCTGTPAKVKAAVEPGHDVYIINYDQLRRHSRLAPFPTVTLGDEEKKDQAFQAIGAVSLICDEAHRIKNPKSKQTRAVWQVARNCRVARIGMTGTPVQDTPEDLWSVLHGLVPGEYFTKTGYVERFLDQRIDHWGARVIKGLLKSHEAEFLANLDTRMRRLTKEVAAPWLPPKMFETRWVELPAKLRKAYDSMVTDLIAELEDSLGGRTTLAAKSILERSGRLIQLANASGTLDADGLFHMAAPSPKVDTFMEDVEAGDFDGESVVVFSDSKQLAMIAVEALKAKKHTVSWITGDVTGEAREAAKEAFQKGEVQFIVITRAGGEGITLTAASTMVRLVRSWSGIVHKQSEDRVHRIGSEIHDTVRIIDYMTLNTVEEGQMARLNGKGVRAQEVLRDAELLDMLKGIVR